MLLLAAIYFLAAKLGLRLAFVHVSASAVWPPTGIALAVLLLLGSEVWPGIFLGAFVANLTTAGTIWTSLGIATGNTLEAVLGALLVTRYAGGGRVFDRAAGIFMFTALAAVLSTIVSATIGVSSLSFGGFARWEQFAPIWLTWWLGDATGALVVTPLVVLWARGPWPSLRVEGIVERVLVLAATLAVGGIVFAGAFPFEFLTVPLLVWVAFRLGPRETATVIALLSVIAVWGTLHGRGPFVGPTPNDSLLLLQAFMAMTVLISLPLAAVVAERQETMTSEVRRRRRLQQELEVEQGISGTLQRSLLPAQLPQIPGVQVAAHYVSAMPEAVGGDWYDVLPLPDGDIGLVIGDVAGKGVAAAAITAKLRHGLRAYALEGHAPAETMSRVNELLERGEMATLLYLVLDPLTSSLRYVCAGHPPALLIDATGGPRFLEGSGLPVGTRDHAAYAERTTALTPGSTLVLYTDGLVEGRAVDIERGLARLQLVAGTINGDIENLPRRLAGAMLSDHAPQDDVAILVLRLTALDPHRLVLRLPALPGSLPQVRHALRRWLLAAGADPAVLFDLTVAVGEACTNAIEHAYGPSDATIEVEATEHDGRLTVAVRDRGTWRFGGRAQGRSEGRAPGGRGLQVMRGLMDSVEVTRDVAGSTVTLACRLRQPVRP
jgi:serine phosphatase RsbU (regulator of sigma subunit)/anti-sigma regulatory factor (Ser/Thr protein kinase)